jgi:hypothetical protein
VGQALERGRGEADDLLPALSAGLGIDANALGGYLDTTAVLAAFGRRVRELREERGLSQDALGRFTAAAAISAPVARKAASTAAVACAQLAAVPQRVARAPFFFQAFCRLGNNIYKERSLRAHSEHKSATCAASPMFFPRRHEPSVVKPLLAKVASSVAICDQVRMRRKKRTEGLQNKGLSLVLRVFVGVGQLASMD